MDEITNVENFFKSHQVHLSRVWLESCIDWCKENLPPNYTLKDLQCNVFEQWLILDLRDVEVACLPPNLSSKKKFTLNDNYTLQLMQVVDISKPKFWQLQRIRNGVPKNLEQELESSKRVLQLTLTDGVQEIEAIEYKTIKCLNLNLSPGKKIRLMGPIQIRRGRVMLEERHIKVIGGEVDTLLVENAAENILAKNLNQPLNPKPESIQENIQIENNSSNETGVPSAIQNQSNIIIHRNHDVPQNHTISDYISTNNTNISRNQMISTSTTTVTKKPPPPIDNFDNFDDEQEFELLMEVEQELKQYNKSNNTLSTQKTVTETRSRTPDMFDDMDLVLQSIEIPPVIDNRPSTSKKQSDISNFFNKPKEKLITNAEQPNEVINISDSLDLESFVSEDILNVNKTFLPHQPVIWPVDKLLKTIPNVTNGKFKIRAKFKSVIEKMNIVNDKFHLVVKVGDDTGDITLKIHNDVVVELIGISEVVFMGFKDGLSKNDSGVHRRLLEALKSLQTRLIALDNVLEVLVNVNETFPVLVKIL